MSNFGKHRQLRDENHYIASNHYIPGSISLIGVTGWVMEWGEITNKLSPPAERSCERGGEGRRKNRIKPQRAK